MSIQRRKLEHLQAFRADTGIERGGAGWEALRLMPRALPELDFDAVDTSCTWLGKRLSFPLLISSMTGGDDAEIINMNRRLAAAAEHCQVALALGSQRIMLEYPSARVSFALREYAPKALMFSNLGAVQLNYGLSLEGIQEALQVAGADALYLHLNPLQEVIQQEGNRNFSGLKNKIAALVEALPCPILLKEVGAGLAPQDILWGKSVGIDYFDVAGRGGTSWSRVEAWRHDNPLGYLFQDWGLSTVEALRLAHQAVPEACLIASGGLRNGIDMVKALLLGASYCGMAAPFLEAARHSTQAVIDKIEALRREFQTTLFLMGCANLEALSQISHGARFTEDKHEHRY